MIECGTEYRDDEYNFCFKCFKNDTLDSKNGRCHWVDYDNVTAYYDKIIDERDAKITELEAKLEQLQVMVDYQPDGKGFVEAKKHFEELIDKN